MLANIQYPLELINKEEDDYECMKIKTVRALGRETKV